MPSFLRARYGGLSIISPLFMTPLSYILYCGMVILAFLTGQGDKIIKKGIRHIVSMIILVTSHPIVSPVTLSAAESLISWYLRESLTLDLLGCLLPFS